MQYPRLCRVTRRATDTNPVPWAQTVVCWQSSRSPTRRERPSDSYPGEVQRMYMRMSLVTLKAGLGDAWRRMVDGYDPLMQQMPGFANRALEAEGWLGGLQARSP
jgi:hypothetical protein